MNENQIKDILKKLDDVPLPKKEDILSACESQSEKYTKAYVRRKPRALIAVCACIFLLASALTVSVVAIENREYREAVAFFEANGLSTEGYSRSEIKKICRDITDNSFTYELTFEAICEHLGISNKDISSEEIKALWDKRNEEKAELDKPLVNGMWVSGKIEDKGTSFVYQVDVGEAYTLEEVVSVLSKYNDGKLVWEKRFKGFSIGKVYEVGDRILLSGSTRTERTNTALMMLSGDGNILWERPVDTLRNIIVDEDTITVIGNSRYQTLLIIGNSKSLYIETFDLDGNRLNYVLEDFSKLGFPYVKYSDNHTTHDANGNEIVVPAYTNPKYYVRQALKVGDEYYLVLEGDYTMTAPLRYMCVARVSSTGEYKAIYEVSGKDTAYRITDIAVNDGELYICGYSYEAENGAMDKGVLLGQSYELDNIEAALIEANGKITDTEFCEMLRAYYTGFVMRCNIETGEVKEAKTVEGAKDGGFTKNDEGTLVYRYDVIADAKYEIVSNDTLPFYYPNFEPYADMDIVYKSDELVIS